MDAPIDYGHWDISAVGEFEPTDFFGFIYEIEQLSTGKAYIGKKQFKFKRKKTKSNTSRTKDSDWRDYTSSSEFVNELIEEVGKSDFAFRILLLCTGRCMLGYEEESIQRERDVLRARLPNGERKFFNRTIGYKNFAGLEKQTEEAKEKNRLAHLGIKRPYVAEFNRREYSEETRHNMSIAAQGKKLTEETKLKMSEAHKGRTQSPEHVARRMESARRTRELKAQQP